MNTADDVYEATLPYGNIANVGVAQVLKECLYQAAHEVFGKHIVCGCVLLLEMRSP